MEARLVGLPRCSEARSGTDVTKVGVLRNRFLRTFNPVELYRQTQTTFLFFFLLTPTRRRNRVEIKITEIAKHSLPVDLPCPWYHRNGIPYEGEGCWRVGDRAVENARDVWDCMTEASCPFKGTLHPVRNTTFYSTAYVVST